MKSVNRKCSSTKYNMIVNRHTHCHRNCFNKTGHLSFPLWFIVLKCINFEMTSLHLHEDIKSTSFSLSTDTLSCVDHCDIQLATPFAAKNLFVINIMIFCPCQSLKLHFLGLENEKNPKTCDYDYWTVGEGFRWLKGEYTHVCMFVCSRACVDVCVHACYVIVCDSKKNVSTGRQCDLLCESGLWSQGGGEWWGGWLTPSTTPWWQGGGKARH